jgi:hypothetical protein
MAGMALLFAFFAMLFYVLPILVPLAVSGLVLMICMWLFRRFGRNNLWTAGATVAAIMCLVGIVWGLCPDAGKSQRINPISIYTSWAD